MCGGCYEGPGYDAEFDCDHEDYEIDILTARATCNRCDAVWYVASDEMRREYERIRAYDEWQRDAERPWNRFKGWLRGLAPWRAVVRWRHRRDDPIDDGIPF